MSTMNDLERLRKCMNEYRETSNVLCGMLEEYLEDTHKPRTERFKKQGYCNALDKSNALRNAPVHPR